jgi:hypothetical protein
VTLATNDDLTFLDEVLSKTKDFKGNYDGTADELEKLADADEGQLPFQNLYLYMYQNVVEGPKNEALKEIAKRTSYSKSQLEKVLFEGNLDPIINREEESEDEETLTETDIDSLIAGQGLSANLESFVRGYYDFYIAEDGPGRANKVVEKITTQVEAMDEYTYLKSLYEDEYSFQNQNRRLLYEAMAAEMFINGDTGDSAGIDLLYDLNLINSVLFNEAVDYPDRGGGSDVALASIMDEFEEMENSVFLASESSEDSRDSIVILSSEEDGADADSLLAVGDDFDASSCDDDSELRAALDAFESSEASSEDSSGDADAGSGSGTDSGSYTSTSSSSSSSSNGSEETTTDDEEESDAVEEFNSMLAEIGAGSPGDWTRMLPCNDIFCITVNLVKENDEPEVGDFEFEEVDNCIACHTQYINERMGETLSKSLAPSKVPMNYFEDATCKDGFNLLPGLRVFVRSLPIFPDKGDDIDEAADEAVTNFYEGFAHESGLTNPDALTGDTKADLACQAALNQAEISGNDAAFDEAMSACNSASAAISAAIAERIAKFTYLSEAESDYSIYEQMSGELYSMLLYLDGMRVALSESFEPINSLINKPYCGK